MMVLFWDEQFRLHVGQWNTPRADFSLNILADFSLNILIIKNLVSGVLPFFSHILRVTILLQFLLRM